MEILVVDNDGAVSVISGVHGLPVELAAGRLVERLLVVVEPHVPEQPVVELARQRRQLGPGVPVLDEQLVPDPVAAHQRGVLLRGPVARVLVGQVLVAVPVGPGQGGLGPEGAGELLALPVPRDDEEDGHGQEQDHGRQDADDDGHVGGVVGLGLGDRDLGPLQVRGVAEGAARTADAVAALARTRGFGDGRQLRGEVTVGYVCEQRGWRSGMR